MSEPLSEHCSLMAHPERTELPGDCPEGAAYIRTTDEGGSYWLNPIAPFPIVVEGGDGNDSVTVLGSPSSPVLIDGGKGDDYVVVQSDWALLASLATPDGVVFLGAFAITLATIGSIAWRAFKPE